MTTLLTIFLSLLSPISALPTSTSTATSIASYNGTTYPVDTTFSFQQTNYPFTNNIYFSANITAVGSAEGACYPHTYVTSYLGETTDGLLSLNTTHETKANGRTPVNAINIGGEQCWGLEIDQGLLVVRQSVIMKGWYVLNGILMNDDAPNGFYCEFPPSPRDLLGSIVAGAFC